MQLGKNQTDFIVLYKRLQRDGKQHIELNMQFGCWNTEFGFFCKSFLFTTAKSIFFRMHFYYVEKSSVNILLNTQTVITQIGMGIVKVLTVLLLLSILLIDPVL